MKFNLVIFNIIMSFVFLLFAVFLFTQGEWGRGIMWLGIAILSSVIAQFYRSRKL